MEFACGSVEFGVAFGVVVGFAFGLVLGVVPFTPVVELCPAFGLVPVPLWPVVEGDCVPVFMSELLELPVAEFAPDCELVGEPGVAGV